MAKFGSDYRRLGRSRASLASVCASLRWEGLLRYAVIAFITSIILLSILLFRRPEGFLSDTTKHYFDYLWSQAPTHPIDNLIQEARTTHAKRLQDERSFDIERAAARYRKSRNRHPPPGFDAWVAYAIEHDAVVVESYFDRIYHDLGPFWGLDPVVIAQRATQWWHVVRVRDGVVNGTGNIQGRVPWLQLWTGLVAEAAPFLPDVDMPINYMDESRLMVPWEEIDRYVMKGKSTQKLAAKADVVQIFSGLAKLDAKFDPWNESSSKPYDPAWVLGEPFWNPARQACAPGSPSRGIEPVESFEEPPLFPTHWNPGYSYKGYVRNFSAAMDPCTQPHLQGMHGTFVEPLSISTSRELIPLFGGCKLLMNNEILIPGAMYLTDDPFYSGGDSHGPPWNQKIDGAVWRGVASGGRNKRENWTHFQRHRLIEMLNGTTVAGIEKKRVDRAPTFEMPSMKLYDFPRRREGTLGTWLSGFADAGFVHLLCFPGDDCSYVEPHLKTIEGMPMAEQYRYKFMPDVDGNSFSARYRGFLASSSLPIKSTIYAEWHDDRLVPWLHFVPMDNTFQDLYGILDYFTRDKKGDDSARFLAEEGRAWAGTVLRREDMLLYVWRLLLEFARVCDEKRDALGFVDDL